MAAILIEFSVSNDIRRPDGGRFFVVRRLPGRACGSLGEFTILALMNIFRDLTVSSSKVPIDGTRFLGFAVQLRGYGS